MYYARSLFLFLANDAQTKWPRKGTVTATDSSYRLLRNNEVEIHFTER